MRWHTISVDIVDSTSSWVEWCLGNAVDSLESRDIVVTVSNYHLLNWLKSIFRREKSTFLWSIQWNLIFFFFLWLSTFAITNLFLFCIAVYLKNLASKFLSIKNGSIIHLHKVSIRKFAAESLDSGLWT